MAKPASPTMSTTAQRFPAGDATPKTKILLLIPPMVEVGVPYPSTAYLTGYMHALGRPCEQRDLSLELFLRLFCSEGLARVREAIASHPSASRRSPSSTASSFFFEAFADYHGTIDEVIGFLRGEQPSLGLRIAGRRYLPEGRRFLIADRSFDLAVDLGRSSVDERARLFASLYLYDIADAIREGVDEHFAFPAYGESIGASAASFDALHQSLQQPAGLVDELMAEALEQWLREVEPDLVGLTAPFKGNILGALKTAQLVRRITSGSGRRASIALGGGYVNTELRDVEDARLFQNIDFLTFDDGERPLLAIAEHLEGRRRREDLIRTRFTRDGMIVSSAGTDSTLPQSETPSPTYAGLDLDRYVPYSISTNPVMRMWTSYHWNKLTLAHGCYWRKCTFCDVSLDYIQRYEPDDVERVLDKIERLIEETGRTAFHFVDEAAPPAMMRALSEGILARGLTLTWWTNIRFESYFTPEVALLCARAGCIAVTGGLEVASDRLLAMMKKGVTIAQVARAAKAFADAGVSVHAYLMFGFPTQTLQELVDSVEVVRQLFAEGCIHSGAWHSFTATAHAPIVDQLPAHGIHVIRVPGKTPRFGNYALKTTAAAAFDPALVSPSLHGALHSFAHGRGLGRDVTAWFNIAVPKSTIAPNAVRGMLATSPSDEVAPHFQAGASGSAQPAGAK
jgi:hypothetical protein